MKIFKLFRELWMSGSGKAGILFFSTLLLISAYAISIYPLDFGERYWSNPAVWADNPKAAPPAWIKFFPDFKVVDHSVFEATEPTSVIVESGLKTLSYIFTLDYWSDEFPSFTSLTIKNVTYHSRPPLITVTIVRPDYRDVEVYTLVVSSPRMGEDLPITRYSETPFRVYLSGDGAAAYKVSEFLKREFGVSIPASKVLMEGLERVVFGFLGCDGITTFQVLKGTYRVHVRAVMYNYEDSIGMVKFVVGGSAYGLMGTDSMGRDLAFGLLFGFPVALLIGLVTSTLTTLIGALLGMVSGYRGGKTDALIQRGCDILVNVPLLPILIFLAYLLGQKLWVVVLILILFSWPSLTVVVRSIVIQIRSSQLVEAAIALGASQKRIILKHIFPQVAPFIFAQMIFLTPSAILAEAALSFLGLGDPSLPTWGQILEQGFRSGGVYVGYWWWIIPPGALIILTALTFVLLALGMEPIVNPRLKR